MKLDSSDDSVLSLHGRFDTGNNRAHYVVIDCIGGGMDVS